MLFVDENEMRIEGDSGSMPLEQGLRTKVRQNKSLYCVSLFDCIRPINIVQKRFAGGDGDEAVQTGRIK